MTYVQRAVCLTAVFRYVSARFGRTTWMNNLLLVILFVILSSSAEARWRDTASCDACALSAANVIDYVHIDSAWRQITSSSPDSCVLTLIDTLADRVMRLHDDQSLRVLEKISAQSDGYVSEYFLEVAERLFYSDFRYLLKFMVENESESLVHVVIEALSMKLSTAEDVEEMRGKIRRFIHTQLDKSDFPAREVSLIRNVESRLDPDIFN